MKKIIFVYNADGGILNGIKDLLHKNLSPKTYDCRLCAVTYDNFGMIREWKDFIQMLNVATEFLHRDELKEQYQIKDVALPAALLQTEENQLQIWISADEMNSCQNLSDLKQLVLQKLHNNTLEVLITSNVLL